MFIFIIEELMNRLHKSKKLNHMAPFTSMPLTFNQKNQTLVKIPNACYIDVFRIYN